MNNKDSNSPEFDGIKKLHFNITTWLDGELTKDSIDRDITVEVNTKIFTKKAQVAFIERLLLLAYKDLKIMGAFTK